ncbi:MAG: SpoIIE family protein phosphatase [Bacteroidales bacterium]|nr:SpoIIE family protein phosphatase [Bacteroidales bacterium]
MTIRLLTFIFLFFLLFPVLNFAQHGNLQFEQITDKNGRSLGFITGMEQDENGFLWVSTRNGLFRYDGYSLKLFKNISKDSTSLPSNDITYMYQDKDNNFWLRNFDRLVTFKDEQVNFYYKELFSHSFDLTVKIAEDKNQNIWIGPGKNGLYKYNKKNKNIEYFKECQPLYTPQLYELLDSINKNTQALKHLTEIKNNTDTTVSFELTKKSTVLLISVGETNYFGDSDYAYLKKGTAEIWKMNGTNSKHAGGDKRNKIEAKLLTLEKGNYILGYISDDSHSFEAWEADKPDKTNFYGTKIFLSNQKDISTIKNLLNEKYISKDAIPSNNIVDIVTDNDNNVYLLMKKGISKYNYNTNSFENFHIDFKNILGVENERAYSVNNLFILNDNFWIGTNLGLLRYNINSDSVKLYQNNLQNKNLLTSNQIYSVFIDSKKRLWVGTDNGLNLLDNKNNTFSHIQSNTETRLYDNRILKIFEDKAGNIWIATFKGLNKLKQNKFHFTDLKIEKYNLFPVCIDKSNIIWYHALENYLYGFNRNTQEYYNYELKHEYFPIDEYGFENERKYKFNDIIEGDNNNLWITIGNGLYLFNKNMGKVAGIYKLDNFKIGEQEFTNNIISIKKDSENYLWVFDLQGIHKFNTKNKNFKDFVKYCFINEELLEESSSFIDYILKENQNYILRTSQGIFSFNPDKLSIEPIFDFDSEQKTYYTKGNIIKDKTNNYWFAILPKLFKLNINDSVPKIYELEDCEDISVSNVFECADNNIWIYTNNGLYYFDKSNNQSIKIDARDGLAGNNCIGIFDDTKDNLYLTTTRGVSKFNKTTKELTNAIVTDNNIKYFLKSIETKISGKKEILFLLSNGFVSFFPDDINITIPPVVINKFALHGVEVKLDTLIYKKQIFIFKHNENFFDFEFSSLDYTIPDENDYAYILEGLDKDTTFTDAHNRRARYTSVPHGEYIFKVFGSNNDKVWNKTGQTIKIIIKPPYWKTWWFISLEILFVIFMIFTYIKYRERKLRWEKRILEEKVKIRTAKIEKQKEEITIQRDNIEEQKNHISEQNKSITDSIQYASRIQTAVLPPIELVNKLLPQHFILYKPRDIVSGDYYWINQKEGKIITIAADCTGHGVPGAFMSMLGISLLNEIINKQSLKSANEILNELRFNIKKSLRQTGKEGETKDGMDLALCIIDMDNMKLQFSGANNPLYIVRNNELEQIKGDKMPIGIYIKDDLSFTNNEMDIFPDDCIYTFSDGYVDQFGGEKGKKFMTKNFKTLILEIHKKPMTEQKEIFNTTIEQWKGENQQIDDILVFGIRIPKN